MTKWWGHYDVPCGDRRHWRIDSASIWVERLTSEWRVAWEKAAADGAVEAAAAEAPFNLLECENVARFGVQDEGTRIGVAPALADRPVVARPEKPFAVPPAHTVTVFVGSPLWLTLSAPPDTPAVFDEPIVRPSNTWFGPDTQTGELCYASRTACRLRLDDLQIRPHRAITAVTIRNRATSHLQLERLKLPVVFLGLYSTESGLLWTESVELVNLEGQDLAPLRIAKGPPPEAGGTESVASPRQTADDNILVRAFTSFFA